MSRNDLVFPKKFFWGTATSSHQIEGDNRHNNWWRFEQRPGVIRNGDKSGRACDSWNLYKKDFALLSKLKQNSYRMSVEWSRLYPEPGKLDKKAMDRYVDMIDQLLKRKITPFVTLLHFTVPAWWEDMGGFTSREPEHLAHFTEFCAAVAERFKGKVVFWNTVNEISIAMLGYLTDFFPPGEKSYVKAVKAINTLLAMHEIAYRTVKSIIPGAKVGLVHNMQIVKPRDPESIQDRTLARMVDFLFNGAILRALKTGKLVQGGKLKKLKGSTDFIGLNYYNFMLVSRRLPGMFSTATEKPLCGADKLCAGIGWEPYPEGLLIAMRRLWSEFPGMPIYITENGIGTEDDSWRRKVMLDHLIMVHRAIDEGIDIRGYFHWSLMDNFEWAQGYSSRFGLVDVNFKNQKRALKDSAKLYAAISGKNMLTEKMTDEFPGGYYRPDFSLKK